MGHKTGLIILGVVIAAALLAVRLLKKRKTSAIVSR
jgi:hypothetical protein